MSEHTSRAAAVTPLPLGTRRIGPGEPCFFIAEAGVNHNGDEKLAHRLVDVAADAGADAVKFQIFDATQVASPDAQKAAYQAERTGATESQLAMLARLALPVPVFRELQQHAVERGLVFLSSPFDMPSADALVALDPPAIKVASGEITNHPLLIRLARAGKPLLISTGMCDMEEVAEALAVVRAHGDPALALFHCVTNYPAVPADCNLAAMATMRAAFRLPVGWSDHTEGINLSLAAAAMGADMLEKHYTLDCAMEGPDHAASLEPDALAALVQGVRDIEAARGTGLKRPAESERPLALIVRRSLHTVRALPAGSVLREEDLIALRPGTGIPPSRIDAVLGRSLRVKLDALARLRLDDLE
ncbi:MAG TPA: N-acetylneuraminate synthase [Burkholderiales bacterium]|nr:N-acetylneuraminate synthase [Burkholderiales bacterium]